MRRMLSPLVGAASCLATLSVAGVSAPQAATAVVRSATAGGPDLVAPTHPRAARRNSGVVASSYNWSGYVQATGRGSRVYTGVTTTFVVTTVNTSVPGDQYSADWVGIGGFDTNKLVQAGVEEDNVGGRALYQAWTEILPQSESPLSLAVSPGDTIHVTVRETANARNRHKQWVMTVADATTGRSAGLTVKYNISGSSAEAIHERPCIGSPCSDHLATLATTSAATFDPAYFTTSAPNAAAVYQPLLRPTTGATLYDIAMFPSNATATTPAIATPSNANGHADGFTVADGSAVPGPPPG
ncbi:MAG TPA: G1 family glutamic endopeptidase [Acidimicrobiales bacterium]|nr:G1 family glutamic endopeptidase [Acidimicrobiales bacterium]